MRERGITLQFCGFGGQGIILSSVILGAAAVTKAGLNACQTQSYGSEARGGECQAEVIVSANPIDSPVADQADILIAMSQSAYSRYIGRLRSGGTLMYDPELVDWGEVRKDIQVLSVPATQVASEIGAKLSANMVMLGFLQQATGMFKQEDLYAAIRENVKERFVEVNLKAAGRGIELANQQGVRVEV
jgi:2-oxoglutarate ferredoxin oxidoreductase subunit gamma